MLSYQIKSGSHTCLAVVFVFVTQCIGTGRGGSSSKVEVVVKTRVRGDVKSWRIPKPKSCLGAYFIYLVKEE